MDIEQLKMILEALDGVGAGAFWLGVLYIGEGYAATVGFVFFTTAMAFTILKAMRMTYDDDEHIRKGRGKCDD